MAEFDEQLERQISRALDGELTQDERLALDRELMRCPEARRLMERYEQLEALSGEALHTVFSQTPNSTSKVPAISGRPVRPGYHRAWWLLPGVVAAGFLAALWVLTPPTSQDAPPGGRPNVAWVERDRVPARINPTARPDVRPWGQPGMSHGGMVPVGHRPTWVDRAVDQGVYGVKGSDGRFYLIEVNRTRTLEKPGGPEQVYPVGGDL